MVLAWKTNQENSGGAERKEEMPACNMFYQPTRILSLESILAERYMHHQEGPCFRPNMSQARWLARDNPETNSIIIKLETVSHVAEQFSWFPLPCRSPPGCPFPIKSFALSAGVTSQTTHFQVLDKSPVLDLGRCPPSCNTYSIHFCLFVFMIFVVSSYHHVVFSRVEISSYLFTTVSKSIKNSIWHTEGIQYIIRSKLYLLIRVGKKLISRVENNFLSSLTLAFCIPLYEYSFNNGFIREQFCHPKICLFGMRINLGCF